MRVALFMLGNLSCLLLFANSLTNLVSLLGISSDCKKVYQDLARRNVRPFLGPSFESVPADNIFSTSRDSGVYVHASLSSVANNESSESHECFDVTECVTEK